MNYQEAREFYNETTKYGSILGLETIKNLLERLDHPERELKVVQVAGTNGKGSTIAYLGSILMEAGYKVGFYNSPAVFNVREVIRVNSDYISEEDYASHMSVIKQKCEEMLEDGLPHPTAFEIETALAFLYLKNMECDICLIECGMGGRDDATNVFDKVLLSIITSISLDHTAFLGETIEEIKKVKEGIIKPGCPVVYAEEGDDIFAINQDTARRAAKELINQGFDLSDHIDSGIEHMIWPGRMEKISDNPLVIIDGAHNPDAVLKLHNYIKEHYNGCKITFVIGVLADKDYDEEMRIIAGDAEYIYTLTPNNSRGLDAEKLASTIKPYNSSVEPVQSAHNALQMAMKRVEDKKSDMILCFGSLSYLSELKNGII